MYQYKIKFYKDTEFLEEGMNKLANEGWEVLSVNVISESGVTQLLLEAAISSGFVVTYKRKKTN